jgi:hypothetical protein
VNFPEAPAFRCALRKDGGAHRILAVRGGQVAEYIAHPLAEAVAQSGDDIVNRVTVTAGVTAILNKCYLRIGRA